MENLTTYLVQRAQVNFETGGKGIDSILQWDYMGASEYEWGALPKSIKAIRDNISEYTYLDIPLGKKAITAFCTNEQKPLMKQFLTDLSKNKIRLKMSSHFDSVIKGEGYYHDRTNFWFDIENNLMFWVKNNEFETKFKELIQTKPV